MKSILMIGMGKFGHHLCRNLCEMGNQVMIVDMDEKKLEDLLPIVTTAKIGDCTNVEVLKSLGVGNFDMCIVLSLIHISDGKSGKTAAGSDDGV